MFVRSSDSSSYSGSQRRRPLVVAAVIIGVVYLFFTGLSTIWTDFLWFDSVDYTGVWRVNILTTIGLGLAGALVVFGFVWGNLYLADRLSPRMELLGLTAEEEFILRFRETVEPRMRWLRLGVAGFAGVLLGIGVAAWRDDFLLFMNPGEFGTTDPQFGLDLSFFVFRLPFWSQLAAWAFNVILLTTLIVAAVHFLNGGIRLRTGNRLSMRSGVKAHLSGLVALLALQRAVAYRIDAYELVFSEGGFFGAGYTDVNARLPALNLLALVSVVAAALLLWNIRQAGWTLAIVSVGAWVFVSIAAAVVYPAIVQRFQVTPNELERERPYIERNIEATRDAWGLDDVEIRPFGATIDLTADDIEANSGTVSNIRLWDETVLSNTYSNLQEIRPFYRVDRVDTDRYVIDGEPTQVMVSVRELEETSQAIPSDWQNRRLIYTHGFGAVISPANEVESDGQPELLVRDVPPTSAVPEIPLDQTRIYFGESYNDDPVIVKTGERPQEVDFPTETGTAANEYDGEAGVPIDGILERIAFALRYRDLNILISSQLRPESKILMERNIIGIVDRIAPFLAVDSDPYPVVVDGRVTWVLDLYTSTDRYPYSEPTTTAETQRLAVRSGLPRAGTNYVRNSVKATVDAFDGTVQFYVVDDSDPLLSAWQDVYPGLFRDGAEMPTGLVEHLRYPQDLFKIQSDMYLDYHMDDTDEFFRKVDAWSIPQDPSTIRRTDLLWGDRRSPDFTRVEYLDRILPYYLLLRLPGEEDLSYVLVQPFTPQDKPNMSSFLVADSTPGRLGRLIDYRLPRQTLVEGTGQVGNRINQDDEISQQFTLWDQQGSSVVLGDLLVVPIEDSVLYFQPVYLESERGGLPLAEFRRVIAVYGDTIEWDTTLDGALAKIFGGPGTPDQPDEPDEPDTPPSDSTVGSLLEQAADAFARADEALRAGDLAEYQRLVDEAERLVDEAISILSGDVEAALSLLTRG